MKVIIILMMLLPCMVNASEVNLTLGIGLPFADNDIMNGNNTGNRWDARKGDVIGSFIVSLPVTSDIDLSVWHHSLLNSSIDDGVTGLSISKTFKFIY